MSRRVDREETTDRRLSRSELRARSKGGTCPMCREDAPFLWTCPCGFVMCDPCMREEAWGMTCNNITWVCPDCGAVRGY